MADSNERSCWEPEGLRLGLICWYARKVSEHPFKGRIQQWLNKALCPGGGWMRSSEGARFHADPREYIGRAIVNIGNFEPHSIRLATELMRESTGHMFLDIGANQGLFTCAVGLAADCGVVAVEAAPEVFTRLQRNVVGNESLRATLVHSCVAPATELMKFFVPRDWYRAAWGGPRPKEKVAPNDLLSFWTFAAPLEEILARLDVPPIHVLKIDVEGYEIDVFSGLDWSGRFRPRHVIMECDPGEREKIEFLKRQGYSWKLVDGGLPAATGDYLEGNLWFTDCRTMTGT